MRKLSRAMAGIAALAAASAAAQEPDTAAGMPATAERGGLEISVGAGFQGGAGYLYKNGQRLDGTTGDVKVTDGSNGSLPVILEVGYRLNPTWFAGLFGQYAYVLVKENPFTCPEGFDCSATQWKFGPRLQYHFSPDSSFDPFLGVGVGIVLLTGTAEGQIQVPTPAGPVPANLTVDSTTRGPEFLNLTFGVRWKVSDSLSLGPALDVSYNSYTVRYGTSSVSIPALGATQTAATTPTDDGPHALFALTLRGTYNL